MPVDPRWQRVQELFHAASSWPVPERQAGLAALEPDEALRAEVLALLEASGEEERAVRRPAPAGPVPERIGPFRVDRPAGAGGRGRVYRALRET
ncbi:MAG TPA: hypothetical protein DEH78_05685, partial [Solibacterales bacterium]|nr:hypothetical protein [Bryobacterales bacterium]